MTIGLGYQDQYLDENAVEQVVQEALSNLELDGKRFLFLRRQPRLVGFVCLGIGTQASEG